MVDEKVRQALKQKDQTIFRLQTQIEQMHQENKEAESLLLDLNSNIMSAPAHKNR